MHFMFFVLKFELTHENESHDTVFMHVFSYDPYLMDSLNRTFVVCAYPASAQMVTLVLFFPESVEYM